MNILVVLESYYPNIGGVERLFKTLCEGFVAHGHSVTVVTARSGTAPAHERLNGVDIRRIHTQSRYLFGFASIPTLLRMAPVYDIILTTSYNAALPAWVAAGFHRKKVVVTFHEVWGAMWFRLPFFGWIRKIGHYAFEQFLLRLPFDRFVAVSHATQDRLLAHRISPQRISVIYNGLDYTRFDGYHHRPPEDFTYCYFGRLGISKGLDILLAAAARFAKQHPRSRLKLIIPTTPAFLYKKVMKSIAQHRLESHVDLHHSLPKHELYHELTTSHCVVIPSYSEGFCFAAVEAIGLGIPVISSGQGALPEVVSGRHLTLPSLTPEALYEALNLAVDAKWERTDIRQFDVEDTTRQYLQLMEEVMEG